MAVPSNTQCAACGNGSATVTCTDCVDHRDDHAIVSPTYYCDSACLDAHSSEHEATCQNPNKTTLLFRAGELLQKAFYEYRKIVFDAKIVRVQQQGNKLVVYETSSGNGSNSLLHPFPSNLIGGFQDECKLLAQEACCDGVGILQPFMHKVISAIMDISGTEMREQSTPMPYSRCSIIRYFNGRRDCDDTQISQHEVTVIELPKGTYIIDLAGAQYGQLAPIINEARYRSIYCGQTAGRLNEVKKKDYGFMVDQYRKVLRGEGNTAFSSEPLDDLGRRLTSLQWSTGQILLSSISAWQSDSGLTLKELLKSKHATFERGTQQLMKRARVDMSEHRDGQDTRRYR